MYRIDLKKNLWLALWAGGILANAYFVLRWLTSDQFLMVRMTNYFLPWIGLVLLIGLMLSLYSKKRKLSLLLLIRFIMVSISYLPLMLRCGVSAAVEGTPLRVMSYNIWRDNQDMRAAAANIQREKPDILLLQEINPEQLKTLLDVLNPLGTDRQFNVAHDPVNLAAVASRFLIKKSDSLPQKTDLKKSISKAPSGPSPSSTFTGSGRVGRSATKALKIC